MSGHCPVCGTPGCNGSCNEMRGLSVREQAQRINEEAIELIEGVMQKHTAAMLEAMKEKVAEQRDKAQAKARELAASQAREAKLREALEKLVRFNSSNEYTEVLSAYIANGRKALSQPTDDTALREMIQKAGEVMRGKTINELETYRIPVGNSPSGELACEWTYDALKEIRDEIRTLPVVTLDDLKGEAK